MDLRPPIVTDADRQWALQQQPSWWAEKAKLRADRLGRRPLAWSAHVAHQAERFERHYVGDRKPAAEWSGLWRRVWWPRADPHVRFPDSAPYEHDGEPHPFFRRGHPLFAQALRLAATPRERRLWEQIGVAQFRPGDPRLERLQVAAPRPPLFGERDDA